MATEHDPPLVLSGTILADRVDELISNIKPSQESVARRHGVQDYVRQIISRCFHPDQVKAYMFGSVPLRTYLPDGDIDLSVFCAQDVAQSMRDTWALKLQSVIEQEQRSNSNAPYKIGDITVINAEVKLLKCLVDNIVVDISFNQMGGLITLNFLEEINNLIGNSNIFKRSIILVKAWCYYESRLLGAHHGLISTYALETLVLYVFNKYHGSIDSPLSVLYNFLVEFSRFDWDHYCLSLLGPVPIKDLTKSSQVDAALAPQQTLLQCDTRLADSLARFTAEMASSKADSGGRGFIVRCLNIMDPLLPTNNLGRSVVRSSFSRIRRAFGHGAALVRGMALKGGELAVEDLDRFFKNTWTAMRKNDPLLGRRLQEQQRLPEHVLTLRQQMGGAHQQLQQQLPAAMQRQMQQWQQQQQGLSEGQDSNGQQSALQAFQVAAATSNGDAWPGPMHPLLAQQQQQHEWLPQYRLGSMLLDAATQAGMALETLLKSPTDRQVAVLVNYLALPQGKAAMQSLQRHAVPHVAQQHAQQQRRRPSLELQRPSQKQQQQQRQQPPPSKAVEQQEPKQQQQLAEPDSLSIQDTGSQQEPSKQQQQQHNNTSEQHQKQQEQDAAAVAESAAGASEAGEAAEGGAAQQQQEQEEQEAPPVQAEGADLVGTAVKDTAQPEHEDTVAASEVQDNKQQQPQQEPLQQPLQSQPLPAIAVAAAAAAAAASGAGTAVLHEDDAFEAEVLSAGGGAVDFTAVKAVLAAEGVDEVPQGLRGSRGFNSTQQQQQQQQQHLQVLQQLLTALQRLQTQTLSPTGHLSLHQLEQFMQRSASVPPNVSVATDAASAAAAAALHEHHTRNERGLERSASTGNLGSDPGSAGAQAGFRPAGSSSGFAGQAGMSLLSVHAYGAHSMASAMAAAVAAAAAASSQGGMEPALLQQLQQQPALLFQQQQMALQQQQQQVGAKDVLNGDFDQLTRNLEMAKSYMFGRPPPSPPPPQANSTQGNHSHGHGHSKQQQQQQLQQQHSHPQQMAGYLMPQGLLAPSDVAFMQGAKTQQMLQVDVQGSSVSQSPVNQHMRTLVQMGGASPVPMAGLQVSGLDAAEMHAANLRGLPHPMAQQAQHNQQQLLHAVLAQQQQQQQQQQQSLLHVLQHQHSSGRSRQQQQQQQLDVSASTEPDSQPTATADQQQDVQQPSQQEQGAAAEADAGSSGLTSPGASGGTAATKYTPPHRRSPAAGSLGGPDDLVEGQVGRRHSIDSSVTSPRHQDGTTTRRSSGALVRAVAAALGQEGGTAGEAEAGPDAADQVEQQQGADGDGVSSSEGISAAPQSMAPIRTAGGVEGEGQGAMPAVSSAAVAVAADAEAALRSGSSQGGDRPGSGAGLLQGVPSATPKTPLSATAAPFVSLRFAAAAGAAATAYGSLPSAACSGGGMAAAAAAVASGAADAIGQQGERGMGGALRQTLPSHVIDAEQGSSSDYASAESTHYESTPGTPVVAGVQGSSAQLFAGSQGAEGGSHDSLVSTDGPGGHVDVLMIAADGPEGAAAAAVELVAEGSGVSAAAAAAGQQQGRQQLVQVAAQQQQFAMVAGANGLPGAPGESAAKHGDQQQIGQPPPPPPRQESMGGQQPQQQQRQQQQQQDVQRLLQQQQQQQQLQQLHQQQLIQQLQQGLLLQSAGGSGMLPRSYMAQQTKKAKLSSNQAFNPAMLSGFSEADRAAMARQGSGSGAPANAAAGQGYARQYQQQQQQQHWQQPGSAPAAVSNNSSRHKQAQQQQQQQLAVASIGSGTFEGMGSLESAGSSGNQVFTPTAGSVTAALPAAGLQATMISLVQQQQMQQQQQWRRTGGSAPSSASAQDAAAATLAPLPSGPASSGAAGTPSAAAAAAAATLLLQQQHVAGRGVLASQPPQVSVSIDRFVPNSSATDLANSPVLVSQSTYPPALSQAVSRALEMQSSLPLSPRAVAAGFSMQHPPASGGLQRSSTEPRNSAQLATVLPMPQQPLVPGPTAAAAAQLPNAALQQAAAAMQILSMVQPEMAAYAAAQAALAGGHPAPGGQQVPQPWLQQAMDWQQHAAVAAGKQQQPQGQKQQGQRGPPPAAAAGGAGPATEKRPSSGATPAAAPNSYMQPQPGAVVNNGSSNNSVPAAVPAAGAGAPAVPAPVLPGGSAGGGLPATQPIASTAMVAAALQGHLAHPAFAPAFSMLHPGAFPMLPWGMVPVMAGGPHGFPGPHAPSIGGGAPAMAVAAGGSSGSMPPAGGTAGRAGPQRGSASMSSSSGGGSNTPYGAHGDHPHEQQQQQQGFSRNSRANSAGNSHSWDQQQQQQQGRDQLQQQQPPEQFQQNFSRFQREQYREQQPHRGEQHYQQQHHQQQQLGPASGRQQLPSSLPQQHSGSAGRLALELDSAVNAAGEGHMGVQQQQGLPQGQSGGGPSPRAPVRTGSGTGVYLHTPGLGSMGGQPPELSPREPKQQPQGPQMAPMQQMQEHPGQLEQQQQQGPPRMGRGPPQQLEHVAHMRSGSSGSSGGGAGGGPYGYPRGPQPGGPMQQQQQQPPQHLHHQSQDSWGSDEAFGGGVPPGWQQQQQPLHVMPADQRRSSRLGQSPQHHHGPLSGPRHYDQPSPDTESGRSAPLAGHLPQPALHQLAEGGSEGGAPLSGRPRLPVQQVGAVANWVQQAADERERQAKAARERPTALQRERTAAMQALNAARAAAAAAAASTTPHHGSQQHSRSGSTSSTPLPDSQPHHERPTELPREPVVGTAGAAAESAPAAAADSGAAHAGAGEAQGASLWQGQQEAPQQLLPQQQQQQQGGGRGRPASGQASGLPPSGQSHGGSRPATASGAGAPAAAVAAQVPTAAAPPAAAAAGGAGVSFSDTSPAAGGGSAERRRSRAGAGGVGMLASRLFNQALHRAVEDHPPTPGATTPGSSSGRAAAAAGPSVRSQAASEAGSSGGSQRSAPADDADGAASGGRAQRVGSKRVSRDEAPAVTQPSPSPQQQQQPTPGGSSGRARKQLPAPGPPGSGSRPTSASRSAAGPDGPAQQGEPVPSAGAGGRSSQPPRGGGPSGSSAAGSGPPSVGSTGGSRRASADGGGGSSGRGSILQQAAARAADGSQRQGGPTREGRPSSGSAAASRGGSRGVSPASSQRPLSASEFMLSAEDFPTLSAAGSSSSLRRDSSSGRLSQSGGGREDGSGGGKEEGGGMRRPSSTGKLPRSSRG